MEAERESVGLAILFTAGIFIADSLCIRHNIAGAGAFGSISLFSMAGALCILVWERRLNIRLTLWQGRSLLWALFLLAGLTAGFIGMIQTADIPSGAGRLQAFAGTCAGRLKQIIDDIPYKDSLCNGVLKAFLTGDRGGLPFHTRDIFRQSGASHLLALSGMHLGIIYILLSKALSLTGNSPVARTLRSITIIAGAGFFTMMTGASPSLVRAFLFIALSETARLSGRRVDGISMLATALMIQLAFNPSIISSVSFQLSYLAMTGIFTICPWLQGLWKEENNGKWLPKKLSEAMRKIWNLCALSISCQIFTGPLAWVRFGTFPQYFLLTNLLCIPLMSLIMFSGIAVAVLNPLGICPHFFISISEIFLKALIFVLETISSI